MLATSFFISWLDGIKPFIEQDTYETYSICFHKHIIPYFDVMNLSIEEIHPIHIKNFVTLKLNGGRCDNKSGGLGKAMVRKLLCLLKQCLNEAESLEIISHNPARSIKMPRTELVCKEAVFLSAEEARIMLNAFENSIYKIPVSLALKYGLRRSEVLGLKWSAIDFNANTIEICHTVVKNLTTECKDKTKTQSSHRKFEMTTDVKRLLLLHREKLLEKQRNDPQYILSDYICVNNNGMLLRPDSLTRGFQRVLKKNKLNHMRFHDLRHSTASILYDSGMQAKEVQEYLGHSDIETTLNIYTHLSRGRKTIATEAMNALIQI